MLTCPSCGRQSPEDFAFCPACSTPLAPSAPAREVRKTVTIVFCDVTGSTALGEQLDPESLRDVQSRYFDAMRGAIEHHGGTVEKYIGDAVMAVFGIPQLHEDDALRAARAVVDMREGLAALNEELARDRGVTLQVHIGVNTGEVVAGDPATGRALVTGDAVNVAARLEQRASPGEILLGEETYRLVRDAIDAEAVAPLELKGKDEQIPAWRLLELHEVASSPRRFDSPMVGRERQLSQLSQAFEAAVEDASCQLFTLLGSAGVGKSRLVEEFISSLGERARVLGGRCLPYGDGITYFPVVEAIKEASGLADFDPPDIVEAKVRSVLEGEEHQDLVCRRVSQVMGVAGSAGGDETFWAIRRFFEASARGRPLVLVFDDIHSGEPTFLDLVEHIADWSRGSPILLLCMARADLLDLRPAWGGGKLNAATVSLEPLTEEQAETLVGNLLGPADLPAEVAKRIVQTAEGNPLFVEEILGMMIDDGVVARVDDRWVAVSDMSGVTVPSSIHALLAARVDRLTPAERMVLEAAAVIGKDFFVGAVLDLVTKEARKRAPSDLMALVRKELIRPERSTLPGEDAFRFRHLLIRDSAYEAIPKAQRAELHERFADWLEREAGDAALEQEEIIAYHLERAHAYRIELSPPDDRSDAIGRRAAARLASAGRRATERDDAVAAANLLTRSLAVGSSGESERGTTFYDLAIALDGVGDFSQGADALDEAIALAIASGDRSLGWLARIARSELQRDIDPLSRTTEEFREELGEAIRAFEVIGDERGLATAWTALAYLEFTPCRYDRAELAARRAAEHARRSGAELLLAGALFFQLIAQCAGSATPDQGLATIGALAEDIARNRNLEACALAVRGTYHSMQGEFERARQLIGLGIETVEEIGNRPPVAVHILALGEAEMEAGDPIAAERAYRRSYEVFREIGWERGKAEPAALLARALCTLGRFPEAEGYAAIARDATTEDDLEPQVFGRSAQASVLASRGLFAEAERLGREAIEMFSEAECPNTQGHIRMNLARVLRMAGVPREAEQVAREALTFFERKGNRSSSASTRAFLEGLSNSGSMPE
jgi:class 3 adenylate cyclase/tetratricopeptide (TPR) repeat protein